MGWNPIQISLTALFLVTAVAVLVVCDLLRRKRQEYCKEAQGNDLPMQPGFEQPPSEFELITLAAEISALMDAGLREDESSWAPIEPVYNPFANNNRPSAEFSKTSPLPMPPPLPPPQTSKALLPPPTVDNALFDLLVSGGAAPSPVNAPVPVTRANFEGAPAAAPLTRLKGMIEPLALEGILRTNKPFTGAAASISVSGAEGRRLTEGQLEWVATYLAGLLDENDYGCRNAPEEFLIVCPGLQRAEAQQRLNEISQRLWEFQLRGIGNHSIIFNCGGIESRNEPLADALASAVERMRLNQRSRNQIYVHALTAHNQAV